MNRSLAFAVGAVFLFALGCSNSDSGSAANSQQPASPPASTTGAGGGSTAATGYVAVQAIFNSSCMPCHASGHPKAGLDLSSYDAVMKGARRGPVVTAGDPKGSSLMQYITGEKTPRMPMNRAPMSDADQKTISDWIQAGAKNQ